MSGVQSYVLSFGAGAFLSANGVMCGKLHNDRRTVFLSEAFSTSNKELIINLQKQVLFLLDNKHPVEILLLTAQKVE